MEPSDDEQPILDDGPAHETSCNLPAQKDSSNTIWMYRDKALRVYHCSEANLTRAVEHGIIREIKESSPDGGFFSKLSVDDLNLAFSRRRERIPHPENGKRTGWYVAGASVGAAATISEVIAPAIRALRGDRPNRKITGSGLRMLGRTHAMEHWRGDGRRFRQKIDLTLSADFLKDLWNTPKYEDFSVYFPESTLHFAKTRISIPSPEILIEIGRGILFEFHMDFELFMRDDILNGKYYSGTMFDFSSYSCFMQELFNPEDLKYTTDDIFKPASSRGLSIESVLLPIGACAVYLYSEDEYLNSIWAARESLRRERAQRNGIVDV